MKGSTFSLLWTKCKSMKTETSKLSDEHPGCVLRATFNCYQWLNNLTAQSSTPPLQNLFSLIRPSNYKQAALLTPDFSQLKTWERQNEGMHVARCLSYQSFRLFNFIPNLVRYSENLSLSHEWLSATTSSIIILKWLRFCHVCFG